MKNVQIWSNFCYLFIYKNDNRKLQTLKQEERLISNSDFIPVISQLYAIANSTILELIYMIFH